MGNLEINVNTKSFSRQLRMMARELTLAADRIDEQSEDVCPVCKGEGLVFESDINEMVECPYCCHWEPDDSAAIPAGIVEEEAPPTVNKCPMAEPCEKHREGLVGMAQNDVPKPQQIEDAPVVKRHRPG